MKRRTAIRLGLTLLITGGCLAYIFWQLDIRKTVDIVIHSHLGWFFGAVAIILFVTEPAKQDPGPDQGTPGAGAGGDKPADKPKEGDPKLPALAQPGYLLGERILAELDPRWPPQCCLGSAT
mgnify:CR=1 FL=1